MAPEIKTKTKKKLTTFRSYRLVSMFKMIHLYCCYILAQSNLRHILCNTYLFVQFFFFFVASLLFRSTRRQLIFLIDSDGVFTYITLLLLHYSRLRKHNAYIGLYAIRIH